MSDWTKVKIGSCCTITKGNTGIQKAVAGNFPMVTLSEHRMTHNEFQFDCEAIIVPLVSSTGHGHASIKRIHYQSGKFALGSILCAIISNDSNFLIPQYLYIYLSYFKDTLLVPLMRGAANVSLSISRIKDVEIYLPSIEKQREIILKIQHLEKEKNLFYYQITNQKTYLKNLRKQILQDAIEGKLTADWRKQNPDAEPASELLKKIKKEKEKLIAEKKIKKEKPLPKIEESEIPFELPNSWVWTKLGEIIKVSSGDFLASYQMNKDGEIAVYGGNGVNGFHNKHNVGDRKIVIGRVGAYCGSIHLTPEKAWVTDNAFVTSFSEINLNKKWLVFLLKEIDLGKLSFDGSQPVISGTKIYSQIVPLPPLAEQQVIVSKLETLMQKCDEAEKEIEKSLKTSELLTKAILAEAFGKN